MCSTYDTLMETVMAVRQVTDMVVRLHIEGILKREKIIDP